MIVERESAILGLPGTREIKVSLDADHSGICKFGSRGGMYKIVSSTILKMAQQAMNAAEAYVPPPPPRPTPSPRPPTDDLTGSGPYSNASHGPTPTPQQHPPSQVHGFLFNSTSSDTMSHQLADHKNMARWEHAKPIAYAIFEEKRGINPDSVETLEAAYEIALINVHLVLYNEAGDWALWVTNACKRVLGPDHALLMKAENITARVLIEKGQHSQAESLLSCVFIRQRDLLGADHIDTLDTQYTLANACNNLGRKDEAITRLQRRLESLIRIFGEKHMRTCVAKLELIEMASPISVQPFDVPIVNPNAKIRVAQILDEVKEVYGPLHPLAVNALCKLGILKSNERNYTDAIDDLRSALSNAEKAWGPNHPQTAFCAAMIGCCYYKQQHYEQASPWLRRYLDFVSSRNGDGNPEARSILQLLTYRGFSMKRENPKQALQDFERLSLAYEDQNCKEAEQAREMANLTRTVNEGHCITQ